MVTLAIEGGGGSELTYELTKPIISIGASSQNDVVIRSPGVAPRHLVIQKNGDVFTFLGQNRQIVVLNGERRARGVLRVGDRIRVGTATVVFQSAGEDRVDIEVRRQEEPVAARPATDRPAPAKERRARSEVVLYSESNRVSEARRQTVQIFRSGINADFVPALRTFFGRIFSERQVMLASLDDEGSFQPILSLWTSEIPRLPQRTFEELEGNGRFALLRLGLRSVVIYPVDRGPLQPQAFLVVETTEDDRQMDEVICAELAFMLAIHWERIESSATLLGAWEADARKRIEDNLPGTSHPIRLLRDSVTQAARTSHPALICGRAGSGRMTIANLISTLGPAGKIPLHAFQARSGDESALRIELFGSDLAGCETKGLVHQAQGGALVLREIQHLSASLQREVAAAIKHDLESGYGPSVRWLATTEPDCMDLLTSGALDATLFSLFQRHIMRVPALSERPEDLPLLVVHLLNAIGAEQGKEIRGIELETLNSLLSHPFEGQMTELLGDLRRLASATPDGEMVRGLVPVVIGGGEASTESTASAAASILTSDDLKAVIPAVERLIIDRVLRRTTGNQSRAARVLNLSRGALIAKIKDYDIPDYRYLRRRR